MIGETEAAVYDTRTDQWAALPALQVARCGHAAALIEDKLFVAGGTGASGGLTSGEVFDFATQQWSPIASLNRPRAFAASAVGADAQGNPLWLIVGGADPATHAPVGDVEVYDVRRNRWRALDHSFNLITARSHLGGAVVKQNFYTFGGLAIAHDRRLAPQQANEWLKISALELIALQPTPVLAVPETQTCFAGIETQFSVAANAFGSELPLLLTAENLPPGARFENVAQANDSARANFIWTPRTEDVGRNFTLTVTAALGAARDARTVTLRVAEAGALAVVNAADYRAGRLAPDLLAAAFGTQLALQTQAAATLPLPTELAGVTVTVNGVRAPLLFVSPEQINFVVPAGLAPGAGAVVVSNPVGRYALSLCTLAAATPALFTAEQSGRGDAAALATPDGINYQLPPFPITVNGQPNNLILFGTGFRHAPADRPYDRNGVAEAVRVTLDDQPARVLYAGAQGAFAGLDQLNVELPQRLATGVLRRVPIVVTIQGVELNRVNILIR